MSASKLISDLCDSIEHMKSCGAVPSTLRMQRWVYDELKPMIRVDGGKEQIAINGYVLTVVCEPRLMENCSWIQES